MCVLLPRSQTPPLDQDPMCFEAHEVASCTLCPDGRTFDELSGTCVAAGAILGSDPFSRREHENISCRVCHHSVAQRVRRRACSLLGCLVPMRHQTRSHVGTLRERRFGFEHGHWTKPLRARADQRRAGGFCCLLFGVSLEVCVVLLPLSSGKFEDHNSERELFARKTMLSGAFADRRWCRRSFSTRRRESAWLLAPTPLEEHHEER